MSSHEARTGLEAIPKEILIAPVALFFLVALDSPWVTSSAIVVSIYAGYKL